MTDTHRCPTCHLKHNSPRPARVLRAFVQGVLFISVEVLAARALDGWLAIAVWLIALWNVAMLAFLVYGLALQAAHDDTEASA